MSTRPSSTGLPARPSSSSSTSTVANVASARFRTFAVQYELLRRHAVLRAMAAEIPWDKLLALGQLRFFAIGDAVYSHGDIPSELGFVLCGGFVVRHHLDDDDDKTRPHQVVGDKMVRVGAGLAAFAVDRGLALPYSVVAVKVKSILLALPVGKYRSILKQLSPRVRRNVQQLVLAEELQHSGGHVHGASAAEVRAALVTAAAINGSSGSNVSKATEPSVDPVVAALGASHSSWQSLHVAKPVEYEVDSSLLILHRSASEFACSASYRRKGTPTGTPVADTRASSASVRSLAQRHATRRLQTIRLPVAVDAFPRVHAVRDDELFARVSAECNPRGVLDVAPKVRLGRLLSPLRKPVMISATRDQQDEEENRDTLRGPQRHRERGDNQWQDMQGRQVLAADRAEPFRDHA